MRTVHAVPDVGINLVDTTPIYGFGHPEQILGKALAEYRHRDQVILATKVALDWSERSIKRNISTTEARKLG